MVVSPCLADAAAQRGGRSAFYDADCAFVWQYVPVSASGAVALAWGCAAGAALLVSLQTPLAAWYVNAGTARTVETIAKLFQ